MTTLRILGAAAAVIVVLAMVRGPWVLFNDVAGLVMRLGAWWGTKG